MEKTGPIFGNSVLFIHYVLILFGYQPAFVHSSTHNPSSSKKGATHS